MSLFGCIHVDVFIDVFCQIRAAEILCYSPDSWTTSFCPFLEVIHQVQTNILQIATNFDILLRYVVLISFGTLYLQLSGTYVLTVYFLGESG